MSVFVIPPVMREYMTTRNRDAPTPETSAGSWDDLRREYEDSKTTILGLRVETEEEGKERAKRLARRRPTVRDVEELDVVRFVGRAAETEVRFYLETAIDWIPDLDAMFEAEVPTLQFLASWGAFQLYYGILMASYLSSGDGLKALRTAVKGGEGLRRNAERETRFVAALIHYWMERLGKSRKFAEHEVANAIGRYICPGPTCRRKRGPHRRPRPYRRPRQIGGPQRLANRQRNSSRLFPALRSHHEEGTWGRVNLMRSCCMARKKPLALVPLHRGNVKYSSGGAV